MSTPNPPIPIDLSQAFDLTEDGITHRVYTYGQGPPVVIMHELPGMTPEFFAFAHRIASTGFRIYLPHFFGPLNKHDIPVGLLFCLRHQFNVLYSEGDSPIANWVRALCTRADNENSRRGVGIIGLCLTGNIVMSAMVLDCVRLGVMGEPALPFLHKAALATPQRDLDIAKSRALVFPMLAYRFSTDTKCTHERFQTLNETFGNGIRLNEICTGISPWDIPNRKHSVFTDSSLPHLADPNHPVQHAIDEILIELRLRLSQSQTGINLNPPWVPHDKT